MKEESPQPGNQVKSVKILKCKQECRKLIVTKLTAGEERRWETTVKTATPVFLQPEMLAIEPKRRNSTHEDKRNSDITENITII